MSEVQDFEAPTTVDYSQHTTEYDPSHTDDHEQEYEQDQIQDPDNQDDNYRQEQEQDQEQGQDGDDVQEEQEQEQEFQPQGEQEEEEEYRPLRRRRNAPIQSTSTPVDEEEGGEEGEGEGEGEEERNEEGDRDEFPDFSEGEGGDSDEGFPDFSEGEGEEEEEEGHNEEEEEEPAPVKRTRKTPARTNSRTTAVTPVTSRLPTRSRVAPASAPAPIVNPAIRLPVRAGARATGVVAAAPASSISRPLGVTGSSAPAADSGPNLSRIPANRVISTSQIGQARQAPAQPFNTVRSLTPTTTTNTSTVGRLRARSQVREQVQESGQELVSSGVDVSSYQPLAPIEPDVNGSGGGGGGGGDSMRVNVGAGFRKPVYEVIDAGQLPKAYENTVVPELGFMTKKLSSKQEAVVARRTLRDNANGPLTKFNPEEGQREVLKQPSRSSIAGTLPPQFAPATAPVTSTRRIAVATVPIATATSSASANRVAGGLRGARSSTPAQTLTVPTAPRRTNVLQSDITQLSSSAAATAQVQSKYQNVVNSASKANVLANMKSNEQNLGSGYSQQAESVLEQVEQQADQPPPAPVTRTRVRQVAQPSAQPSTQVQQTARPSTRPSTQVQQSAPTTVIPRRRYSPVVQQ